MALEGTLSFLGFGNMGEAMLSGLVAARTLTPDRALVFDVAAARRDRGHSLGARVADSPAQLVHESDTLILAPKPQDMDAALATIKGDLKPSALVISIAAGISTKFIQARLGEGVHVVRVMPNTPAMVNASASGVAFSANCTPKDEATALEIFGAIGVAERVPESAIDAVTGLSGSGPAYFFYMVECLAAAAVEEGLTEQQAARLAAQTLYGAGKLLVESGESAATLRERVTSKGGTTFAALEKFRANDFPRIVAESVHAAAARSRELGQ